VIFSFAAIGYNKLLCDFRPRDFSLAQRANQIFNAGLLGQPFFKNTKNLADAKLLKKHS